MVRGGLGLGPELQEITSRSGRAETRPPPHSNEVEAGQGACSGGWRSGAKDGGPIAQLDVPERFRWLTAVRSSCIQTSRPHAGFSDDLDRTLERLFKELVL